MAVEFRLPELGEAIEQAEIIAIAVSPGDFVEQEQTLLEIETDKAAMELPSPAAGTVQTVHVKVGDEVPVGALLVTLTEAGTAAVDSPPLVAEPAIVEAPTIVVPPVAEAQPALAPVERIEKPSSPPSTPQPDVVLSPETTAEVVKEERLPSRPPVERKAVSLDVLAEEVLAGPATRRLARELGVDLRFVKGSGPRGRITTEEIKAFVRERVSQPTSADAGAGELPDFTKWGRTEIQPFRSVRKKMAAHMSLAWSRIPHVTQHDEADVTELESLRKTFRTQAESAGGKLTLMAFILKASVLALRKYPQFNSSLDLGREELILKQYYNVGVAVDTDRGLLVPVLRDVDRKGVIELAVEMTTLAERTRESKVKPEDLQGGTFTITNLGGIGGTGFTPIVNYPEVAILGVSRTRPTPVLRAGEEISDQLDMRLMVPLSLSYDHRVIDGAAAARFTRYIAELLENPAGLLQLR